MPKALAQAINSGNTANSGIRWSPLRTSAFMVPSPANSDSSFGAISGRDGSQCLFSDEAIALAPRRRK